MEPERNRRKKFALGTLLAVLVVGMLEGFSVMAIRLTQRALDEPIRRTAEIFAEQSDKIRRLLDPNRNDLLALDSSLGWRYRADYRSNDNVTNSLGLRSTREYPPEPGRHVLRVAAFGDSFVYGNEVPNSQAWPAVLERSYPGMEVLNYGVGGYGLDQAYLRYLSEGTALKPAIVLIGFVSDDLGRVVNVYRRFRSSGEIPLTKPRFVFGPSGDLRLIPTPIRRPSDYAKYLRHPQDIVELGRYDQWFEPVIYANPLYDWSATVRLLSGLWVRVRRRYLDPERLSRDGVFNERSTAFKLQVSIFERFADTARASGAVPIVVFLPDRESVDRARSGERTDSRPLMDALKARRLDYLDATGAFLAEPDSVDSGRWFMGRGHYSPLGNELIASWLGRRLRVGYASARGAR